MAMQYPAMAMQQHMMYNQHYVPYYHPQQQPQPTQGQKHGNQIQNGAEDNKRSGLEISSRGWTKVISSRAFLNLERLTVIALLGKERNVVLSDTHRRNPVLSLRIDVVIALCCLSQDNPHKQTGHSERYGFIEFNSHEAAEKVLQSLNGTTMLNTEQPFRLNWAAFSTGDRRPNTGVVADAIVARSKGYGFVRFGEGAFELVQLMMVFLRFLQALSKVLRADELYYLEKQFGLLSPDANAGITLETIKMGFFRFIAGVDEKRNRCDEGIPDPGFPRSDASELQLNTLGYRKMHRDEFCAAALSVHQMEIVDGWEERARSAYAIFERDGNRAILIQELASELGLSPTVPIHAVLQEHIRHSDGKLTLQGFLRLLHTLQPCSPAKDTVRATIEFRITMGIQNLPFG
ncbi:hypothetical protein SASPL_131874 [Salvia splendens]|uniref:RRM domain-containing protein n=1 Tax=Salvia splendens TaxID=180675 RepID=A0A8X8XA24_SALSN|nr:hypothetical protein SASPL_131874 [Salvia splendens]